MIRGIVYCVVVALTLACTTPRLTAQSTVTTSDPLTILAIPEGLPIMCREPPPDPAHPTPGAVLREFHFGSRGVSDLSWPREITVAFDSAGHTVILSDEVNLGIRGGQSAFGLWGTESDSTGKVIVVTVDSAALAAATAKGDLAGAMAAPRPPVSRDLSPNEWARARLLGTWLWEHRCGRK